jgi:hypothetical protein
MITTPKEFAAQMQKIRDTVGGDEEAAHADMDNLMAKVLIELGYRDGIAIFDDQGKWYA